MGPAENLHPVRQACLTSSQLIEQAAGGPSCLVKTVKAQKEQMTCSKVTGNGGTETQVSLTQNATAIG